MATCVSAAIILCVNSKSSILLDKRDSLWGDVFEMGERVVPASPAGMAVGSRIRCQACAQSCFTVKVTHF